MDSLLDTMTNVVGILVILLVVTQLGVSTAVKRIRSNLPEVDAAQVEKARAESIAAAKALEALRGEWAKVENDYKENSNRLVTLSKSTDASQADRHAELLKTLELLSDKTEKGESNEADLQSSVEKLKSELEKVRNELAEMEKLEKPPEKVVRIPNPRPAPKDAKGEWFVCFNGRVTYVNVDGIALSAAKRLSMMKMQFRHGAAGLSKQSANTPSKTEPFIYDRAKVENYFKKNKIVIDEHRVSVFGRGYHPACWLTLEFNMRRAEDITGFLRPWSKLRKSLAAVKKRGNYANFIVYPDSFEAYLKAREVANEMNVPAGWQVNTNPKMMTWRTLPGISLNKTEDPPPPPPPPAAGTKKPVAKPKNVLD